MKGGIFTNARCWLLENLNILWLLDIGFWIGIMKLMLEDKDVQKLIEVFATREELREMISRLVTKEEFSNLQTAIDAYAKKVDTYTQEMLMLAHKVDRHEKWLHQIAEKLGIKLEY